MLVRAFKLPGVVLLIALACANTTHAATISQSVNLGYLKTNANSAFIFKQFDPLLGTLNSVVATFSGDFQNKVGFVNLGSAADFGIKFTQQVSFKGPDNALIHTSGPLSTSFNQSMGASGAHPLNFRHLPDFDYLNPLPTQSFFGSHTWAQGVELALFTGLGTASLPFAASAAYISQIENGFGIVLGQTNVRSTVDLAYNYAAAVPEPETYLMLLAGLSVTWLRFRRSGNKNKMRVA